MNFSRPTIGLVLSFCSIGALALVLQTLLLREFLVIFSGNELGLGFVFSFWLLGVTVGAFVSGHIAKYVKDGIIPFVTILILFVIISPFSLYFVRFSRHLWDIPVGQYASFSKLALTTALISIPTSFSVGFLFPLAGIVGKKYGLGDKSVGTLYTYEAVGATIAGVIFTFCLAGKVDAFNSLALFILFAIFMCAVLLFLLKYQKGFLFLASIGALLFIAVEIGAFSELNRHSILVRWNRIAPGLELVESTDSMYQNLCVGRLSEQFSFYGNGEVFSTIPDPYAKKIEANLIACQHPKPRNALMIGSGAEEMAPYLKKHGINSFDIVETDKMALTLIHRYFPKEDEIEFKRGGFRQIAQDARVYVHKIPNNKYDLIILNLPDPSTAMVNRFYTKEFFEDVKLALKPDGVFTLSVTSGSNYVGEQVGLYVGSVNNTLRAVFRNVVILPGDTCRMFASKSLDSCSGDWELLQARYKERNMHTDEFSPVIFQMLMPPMRMKSFQDELMRYNLAQINTDRRPITYFYNLLLWDQFSGGQLQSALQTLHQTGFSTILFFILFIGSIVVITIYVLRKTKSQISVRFSSSWLIFSTGLAGMGVEMIILLAFQNIHGALYERIGLFVAIYMLGLSIGGGWITRRIDKRKGRIIHYIYISELMLIIAPVLFALVSGYRMSPLFFYLSILMVGIGAGAQFPSAIAIASNGYGNIGRLAGLIDWSDHLGAFLGAIITGIFLIPIFGLPAACIVVATLKISSLVSIFLIRNFVNENG